MPNHPPTLNYNRHAPRAPDSERQGEAADRLRDIGIFFAMLAIAASVAFLYAALVEQSKDFLRASGICLLLFGSLGTALLVCSSRIKRGSWIAAVVALALVSLQEGTILLLALPTAFISLNVGQFAAAAFTLAFAAVPTTVLAVILIDLVRFLKSR